MQITKENWLTVWKQLPVRADQAQSEILALGTPQISLMNAGTGKTENACMMLEVVVLMLLDFYGVEWTKVQIKETAELWHQEYYWLHIAEIKHFLTCCKVGKFGKVYGKLSPITLLEWLQEYAECSLHNRSATFTREADKIKYREERERHESEKAERLERAQSPNKIAQLQKDLTDRLTKESSDKT